MKRLSCSWGNTAACISGRTDAKSVCVRCEQRDDDDDDESDQYETDPGFSHHMQPVSFQLEVRPHGNIPLSLLGHAIPQLHAFAPAPRLLAPGKSTRLHSF